MNNNILIDEDNNNINNENENNNNNNNNEQPNENKQGVIGEEIENNNLLIDDNNNLINANNDNNQELENEEEAKKKKKENLRINAQPNNQIISNAKEIKRASKEDIVSERLNHISKGSGLNLKAYFIEDNKKEIDQIAKGNLGYCNFTFNGDMKAFYSKVYKHILESNLIARQLADEKERENLLTFKELSEEFEEFMKTTGEELVKRGHLDKYEPFGGLSAAELKEIETSCLLNRPQTEKDAINRNIAGTEGKNFDELVETSYKKTKDIITNSFGEDFKKGDDPKADKDFLETSANLIKGYAQLRKSEKVWKTYTPDFSAPKWERPIYKNLLSNGFNAIGRGIGILFDCTVKFPINNALRGIRYPFSKLASVISAAYNQRKLEGMVYKKGFSKEDLKQYINGPEKPLLDVEKDVKAVEQNFKDNQKKIDDYKLEQKNAEKEKVVDNNDLNKEEVLKEEQKNPNIERIEVKECDDNLLQKDIVPEIKENVPTKTKNMGLDAV